MITDEMKSAQHGISPYGANRETRRKWRFRLLKQRGAGITKSGMGERKFLSKKTVEAMDAFALMFANIKFDKKGERICHTTC